MKSLKVFETFLLPETMITWYVGGKNTSNNKKPITLNQNLLNLTDAIKENEPGIVLSVKWIIFEVFYDSCVMSIVRFYLKNQKYKHSKKITYLHHLRFSDKTMEMSILNFQETINNLFNQTILSKALV